MSSLSEEFQILLPKIVTGNPINKHNQYEKEFAKPLDLPGEWEVAFIKISYFHNWINFDKSLSYFLLRRQLDTEHEPSNFVPDANKN